MPKSFPHTVSKEAQDLIFKYCSLARDYYAEPPKTGRFLVKWVRFIAFRRSRREARREMDKILNTTTGAFIQELWWYLATSFDEDCLVIESRIVHKFLDENHSYLINVFRSLRNALNKPAAPIRIYA